MYNFGAETLLGGGDTTTFVVPSAAIDRALSSTFVASKKLSYTSYEGPTRFWPHSRPWLVSSTDAYMAMAKLTMLAKL